jgi:hypothetical protein
MTAVSRLSLSDLPEWPAALDVQEALAYTRLSESELRRRAMAGEINFKPVGPNGKKVCRRVELDELLQRIWTAHPSGPLDPLEDMDFGDD